MSSSHANESSRDSRAQRRSSRLQSTRGQEVGEIPTGGNPVAVTPYQVDAYGNVIGQGGYYGIAAAQTPTSGNSGSGQRTRSSTPAVAQYGRGTVAQAASPTHYNASLGPVHLSVPSHQPSRSHSGAPAQYYSGQVYPPGSVSGAPMATPGYDYVAQPNPRPAHSLKRAYDDFSRSNTPASQGYGRSGSGRNSSESPKSSGGHPSASPTPSPSYWTPSPSPSMGTVDLAGGSSKGKSTSGSSSSRRSKSGGASSSRHRANPPGLPAEAFNTFVVTPSPASQLNQSGAMYMGAVDFQSTTNVVEHGPTELPPRQYVGGSDAVSPWAPKKNIGTIPGSAMDYLPALEDRLSRLELNVGRYVEYRGEKAVKNAIAPDLKRPDSK